MRDGGATTAAVAAPAPAPAPLALLSALRPAEWVKNALVVAPLLFAGAAGRGEDLAATALTLAAFCAAASAGYLFNDVRDRALDREHSQKRLRAVASGALSVPAAVAGAAILTLAALGLAVAVSPGVAGLTAGYLGLAAAYTLGLKRVVIVDAMAIAGCFELRVLAGTVAIGADASRWLIVCTGMLALLLAFTKRRQEVVSELSSGHRSRPVLEHYSLAFLDQMVSLVTAGTVIAYAIYATESPLVGDTMLATVPPVLYGTFRYLYLIYHRADPRPIATLAVRDPGLLAASAAWVAIAAAVLYL